MELFGLGWVLRHVGYFGCFAWLFFMATGGAILGLRYARQNKRLTELTDKNPQIGENVAKYAVFLWFVWLLSFGVQYWVFNGFLWWMGHALLAAAGSFLLSVLITVDDDCNLAIERSEPKFLVCAFSSLVILTVTALLWDSDVPLLSSIKEERMSYYNNLLVKVNEVKKHDAVVSSLTSMGAKPHPYFYAIAKLRMQKRNEAATHFKAYAESLPGEKQMVWLALHDFFRNDFWSAEKFFTVAGQEHHALWSRFRNNQLTPSDLKLFVDSHSLGNHELSFYSKMLDVLVSTETLRSGLREVKTSENIKLLEELRSLKQMVQELKRGQDATLQGKEKGKSASTTLVTNTEGDRVGKLRDELNVEIEKRVIAFAVKQAPPLPIPAMEDFESSNQYFFSCIVVLSAFPFFIFSVVGVNVVWREKGEAIKEFFETWLRGIGLPPWIYRLGWHSKFARTIAVGLAEMEPKDEKGLFSKEIKRIHATVFPVDILVGFWYRFKIRRILVVKHMDMQEREDLLFIHGAVRKLSGRLIPHGDEQVLSIIMALRERADIGLQDYRKGQLKFLPVRDELLLVQKELVTLGDILEAFGEKPDLTNYHLLGLEPKRGISDTEVKQAYRSVMSAVHPDRNPNNKFVENLAKLVTGAYAILGNPNRRASYETTIRL